MVGCRFSTRLVLIRRRPLVDALGNTGFTKLSDYKDTHFEGAMEVGHGIKAHSMSACTGTRKAHCGSSGYGLLEIVSILEGLEMIGSASERSRAEA